MPNKSRNHWAAVCQAQSVKFSFEQLGWKSFQDLCLTIAERKFGLSGTSFGFGRDEGRDGSAIIRADTVQTTSWGKVAIQCKHTSQPAAARETIIDPELEKIDALVRARSCNTYVFFTNRTMSAGVERKIVEKVLAQGVQQAVVIGAHELDRTLTNDKELRGLVPRVYGLGDISEIIDERVYRQTQAILSAAEIDRFVPTNAYFGTLEALETHNFALLLGEPASGKTAIMRAAAIAAADRWKSEALWLTSLQEVRTHWNADRIDQLLLIDDAFGSTNFDPEAAEVWNRCIPMIDSAMRRGTKLILTSRDYVYAAAREFLKQDNLPVIHDGQVGIRLESLSLTERRQIVYNHLRLGNQPKDFKTAVKPHLNRLTKAPSFLPEVARRLGDSRFTLQVDPSDSKTLFRFVLEPKDYLIGIIRSLSGRLKGVLVVLMGFGGYISLPLSASQNSSPLLERLNITAMEIGSALRELDGSLVQRIDVDGRELWKLRHPTVEEAVAAWLLEHPELFDVYLKTASLKILVKQVCCGGTVRGAVHLPRELWPELGQRLMLDELSDLAAVRFFAYRCSSEAIHAMNALPWIRQTLDKRGFTAPLDNDPCLRLLLRLASTERASRQDLVAWLTTAVSTGAKALDPYPLTNPAIAQLCVSVQDEEPSLEWPSVVEEYIASARAVLSQRTASIMRQKQLEVDRPDAVAALLTTCDVLIDWIDDDEFVAQMKSQMVELRIWAGAGEPQGPIPDVVHLFMQVIFGIAAESDMFMDVDAS